MTFLGTRYIHIFLDDSCWLDTPELGHLPYNIKRQKHTQPTLQILFMGFSSFILYI